MGWIRPTSLDFDTCGLAPLSSTLATCSLHGLDINQMLIWHDLFCQYTNDHVWPSATQWQGKSWPGWSCHLEEKFSFWINSNDKWNNLRAEAAPADAAEWQFDKVSCLHFYRSQHMSEKSVTSERNCWKRLATWRRRRRKLWRLLPAAQQSTFRTCKNSSSVSNLFYS